MVEVALGKNKGFFFTGKLDLKKAKLIKFYIWGKVLDVADTWTLRKPATPFKFLNAVLEKDGKISCTYSVKNVVVLQTVNVKRNIPYKTELRKDYLDWSHLAQELSSETCSWRKDRKNGKTRKTTQAATGTRRRN
jgi:hypothetical protein